MSSSVSRTRGQATKHAKNLDSQKAGEAKDIPEKKYRCAKETMT